MSNVYVQFSDSKQATVVAYFAGPQDPAIYPNQGQIPTSDPRYATFFNIQNSQAQTSLPAINS